MQIKKQEIQDTILEVASIEFVKKGYDNASLRTIAKKANTSLGNIYNYYPSKEAILDALLLPEVEDLKNLLEEHFRLNTPVHDAKDIDRILDKVDVEDTQLRAILCREFVLLVKTDVPKYVEYREQFLSMFRKHVAWHMNVKEDNHFIVIISNMMIDCIMHYVQCEYHTKRKKEDFVEMFKMLCAGFMGNDTVDKIKTDDSEEIK
ncbi:MAG: TetR/AcrR family transcriptional regulator [Coprobacillus sp.]